MRFVLHEIRLWLIDNQTRSLCFLPNKINVVTGDATTGKTSLWNISDYCLLSDKVHVASPINEKVNWYGIAFTINGKNFTIVRRSPQKNAVSADICFGTGLSFPETPQSNIKIADLKASLDGEFGITDKLRFPFGGQYGKASFNLTYRYFLLFIALTESIIGTPQTYFDTTFFGKEEYDKALSTIFDLVIGIDDMENRTINEQIKRIDKDIKQIQRKQQEKDTEEITYRNNIFALLERCVLLGLTEQSKAFNTVDDAISEIRQIVEHHSIIQKNDTKNEELEELTKRQTNIKAQINAINRYQREYNNYIRNLNRVADSIKPIEFLRARLLDQLLYSSTTQPFINSIEESLVEIKAGLKVQQMPLEKVTGNIDELKRQLKEVNLKIEEIERLNKEYQTYVSKLIAIGEIKNELSKLTQRKELPSINVAKLNELIEEKNGLEQKPKDIEEIKFVMKNSLNDEIQKVYDQITTMPSYQNHKTFFDSSDMVLKLQPSGELFPIDNVGSKSNYMFMHICLYLGLHSHILKAGQEHVPQFLFIDQPSIPYYSGGDSSIGNNDEEKLMNVFTILNDFITEKIKQNQEFQILMVEHAPKSYWEDNGLNMFFTVDEFIKGNGLIPQDYFKNK